MYYALIFYIINCMGHLDLHNTVYKILLYLIVFCVLVNPVYMTSRPTVLCGQK